jgi:hypothetical protein
MVARSVFVTRTPESGLATIGYTTHVLALVNKRLRIATVVIVTSLEQIRGHGSKEKVTVDPSPVSKELKKRWSYFIRKIYETDPLTWKGIQGDILLFWLLPLSNPWWFRPGV